MADVAEMKDYQKVLLLTSHLFEYPDAAWWKDLPDCRQAVREIEAKQPDAVFGDFLDFVEETGRRSTRISTCGPSTSRRTRISI